MWHTDMWMFLMRYTILEDVFHVLLGSWSGSLHFFLSPLSLEDQLCLGRWSNTYSCTKSNCDSPSKINKNIVRKYLHMPGAFTYLWIWPQSFLPVRDHRGSCLNRQPSPLKTDDANLSKICVLHVLLILTDIKSFFN